MYGATTSFTYDGDDVLLVNTNSSITTYQNGPDIDNNLRVSAFTGREYDTFTGLYYYRARMYDPKLGRFISEDPIGFAGGDVNLYGYVRNNPQNWRDPDGTSPIPTVLIGRFTPVSVDEFQIYLALFGMIPGAGEAADAVDTGISAARGDYCEVGLGVASMAPIGGWGPGLGKL